MSSKITISALVALLSWESLSAASELTLSQAYQKALQNESRILASRHRTEAMDEVVAQAKSRLYPQVQLNASFGHNKYQPNYKTKEVSEPYKHYSISAYMPIYRPGLWDGIDQAKLRREGASYTLKQSAHELGLEVAKAYFNLARTEKNAILAKAQMEAYEAKYRQLSNMIELGLSNKMDVLEAKVHFDKAKAESLAEQQRLNIARLNLEYMIGEKLEKTLDITLESINPSALIEAGEAWESALGENPEVKLSEIALKIANEEIESRRSEHYPSIDLRLTKSKADTEDTSLRETDSRALIEVSVPLYQGGMTQSRIKEARILQNAAIHDLEHAKKQAKVKLEGYLSDRALSVETLKALQESQLSAKLYLSSVEQGYEKGLKSLFDLLEARAKLYQVRRDLVDAAYSLIVSQLNLLDVTGALDAEAIEAMEKRISL